MKNSRSKTIESYVTGKTVLDLGVVQHSVENVATPTWLHKYIADKAAYCIGVDIEQEGINSLSKMGFNVICADVQTLNLEKRFDVVVAGELIEHLHNFESFLLSVRKHLNDSGRLILTTPNSLFIGYVLDAVRGRLKIHNQHTCWFDEVTIQQLLRRFGFDVESTIYLGSRRWLKLPIPKRTTASTLMIIAKPSPT